MSRRPEGGTARHPAAASRRQAGFALLLVLWSLLLLSIVTTALNRDARDELRLARNGAAAAKAEALADAGIARAVFGLLNLRPEERWRGDDRPYAFPLGAGRVDVRVQDEAGLIDLNAAPEELLASLFSVAGAPDDQAATVARGIAERRSTPDLGGPFEAVEALVSLPGMSRDLLARAAPFLTVATRQRVVDATVAPMAVVLALGTDPQAAEAMMAEREGSEAAAGAAGRAAPSQRRLFRIRAEATVDGARFVRVSVIRLTYASERPYLVLSWRRASE
ncbi:MAG TPA: hypothetical protein VD995_16370 [Azospirillum sp.]|nr:hypothetical protein [Azospirillum sp.]